MKATFAVLNQMVGDGAIENYAVAGAVGAMFYVEPFSTQDIDVLVVTPGSEDKLVAELPGWDYLREHGFEEIRKEGIVVEGWPVQFLLASEPLEREAYLNAEKLDFDGTPVRVALAEHLVAIMLKVGRLKDFARIQMFLTQDAVDRETLEEIISRHGLEGKWANFRSRFLS
jgi:hypothetical protein